MAYYERWKPYVSVAKRRAQADREAKKMVKKGQKLRPIQISSRVIATSFWGDAWCKNLENYADWANRLPRGKTYARNGSIIDLQIFPGEITSLVSGSSLYKIHISIDKLDKKKWKQIREDCSKQVSSLLDLLRGKLPDTVLKRLTDSKTGMFPHPNELKLGCSCPDYATMCKHVAATLYGIGHLLDTEPELFFKMRGVDQSELVTDAIATQSTTDVIGLDQQSDFVGEDLGAIFGIDIASSTDVPSTTSSKSKSTKRARSSDKLPKAKSVAITEPEASAPVGKKTSKKVSRKAKTASPAKSRSTKVSKTAASTKKVKTKAKPKVVSKPTKKPKKRSAKKSTQ